MGWKRARYLKRTGERGSEVKTWLYEHAHWLYKLLSGPAYELNCEIEELSKEIQQLIKKIEQERKINEIIASHRYLEEIQE